MSIENEAQPLKNVILKNISKKCPLKIKPKKPLKKCILKKIAPKNVLWKLSVMKPAQKLEEKSDQRLTNEPLRGRNHQYTT